MSAEIEHESEFVNVLCSRLSRCPNATAPIESSDATATSNRVRRWWTLGPKHADSVGAAGRRISFEVAGIE